MTLVDSNILLEFITEDPVWLNRSTAAFQARLVAGALLAVDIVFSEVSVRFSSARECRVFFDSIGVGMMPLSDEALWRAGQAFQIYRRRGGAKTNVLPVFFIGAQASVSGLPILTRDSRRYAQYFPDVELILPA